VAPAIAESPLKYQPENALVLTLFRESGRLEPELRSVRFLGDYHGPASAGLWRTPGGGCGRDLVVVAAHVFGPLRGTEGSVVYPPPQRTLGLVGP
jgi:hypothetical protein